MVAGGGASGFALQGAVTLPRQHDAGGDSGGAKARAAVAHAAEHGPTEAGGPPGAQPRPPGSASPVRLLWPSHGSRPAPGALPESPPCSPNPCRAPQISASLPEPLPQAPLCGLPARDRVTVPSTGWGPWTHHLSIPGAPVRNVHSWVRPTEPETQAGTAIRALPRPLGPPTQGKPPRTAGLRPPVSGQRAPPQAASLRPWRDPRGFWLRTAPQVLENQPGGSKRCFRPRASVRTEPPRPERQRPDSYFETS